MRRRTPIAIIGGRGPHGLALHLLLRDRGLEGTYTLIDDAAEWLPSYGTQGPMQHVTHLRSPNEFDFTLGDSSRSMAAWRDARGEHPLSDVYSLAMANDAHFNEHEASERHRARRSDFHAYASDLARCSHADDHVVQGRVTNATPKADGWTLELDTGDEVDATVLLVAVGVGRQRYIPEKWRDWWFQLPDSLRRHSFDGAPEASSRPRHVAIVGSSNSSTWETAIAYADNGAHVTLLSRHPNPVERQFPFPTRWCSPDTITSFANKSNSDRKRMLKKAHIPRSTVPGSAERASKREIRIKHHARVRHIDEAFGQAQVVYDEASSGRKVERFDLVVAATGASPRIRELPFLAHAARSTKAPVNVGGPTRNTPILDPIGRWKGLPPIYPLGAFAFGRVGYAALTLASASHVLPLMLDDIASDAGLTPSRA